MDRDNTPKSTNDLIAALADGELDMRNNPEALAKLAEDPQAAQRIACQQQLREACAKAMDGPEMACPDALAAKLMALADGDAADQPASAPAPQPAAPQAAYDGPPVIARIGRWAPTAVAAMILLVAGVMFMQATGNRGINTQAAAFLSVDQIDSFTGRHGMCAMDTSELKQVERFGNTSELDQLPGRLSDYFQTSTDGMQLSLDGIGYNYQLTGVCGLPGQGAVHIVYQHEDDTDRSISVWVMPATEEHDGLEDDRVYVETGTDLMHPVILWRDGGLLYLLVGDSIEDCNRAVQTLREPV